MLKFIKNIKENIKNHREYQKILYKNYPHWDWNKPLRCKMFYFIPQEELHSSGYRFIKIIAVTKDDKEYIKTVCSDVLHFSIYKQIELGRMLFHIDVTKEGLIRFFLWNETNSEFELGSALSDFDIKIVPTLNEVTNNEH